MTKLIVSTYESRRKKNLCRWHHFDYKIFRLVVEDRPCDDFSAGILASEAPVIFVHSDSLENGFVCFWYFLPTLSFWGGIGGVNDNDPVTIGR